MPVIEAVGILRFRELKYPLIIPESEFIVILPDQLAGFHCDESYKLPAGSVALFVRKSDWAVRPEEATSFQAPF